MVYSPFFSPLQNAVCFIILTYLVSVLFTFYIQVVLKLKKNYSVATKLTEQQCWWCAHDLVTLETCGALCPWALCPWALCPWALCPWVLVSNWHSWCQQMLCTGRHWVGGIAVWIVYLLFCLHLHLHLHLQHAVHIRRKCLICTVNVFTAGLLKTHGQVVFFSSSVIEYSPTRKWF